jgi:hypothetical protein
MADALMPGGVNPSKPKARPQRRLDNSGAPPGVPAGETESQDDRALSLGADSAGGYAVPYQLDGTKTVKPKKSRKPAR